MANTSYLFSNDLGPTSYEFPTVNTHFGMSSLANSAASVIAYDPGSSLYRERIISKGNHHKNNTIIYSDEKSLLGMQNRETKGKLYYKKKDKKAATTPNTNSLDSKYRLRS